MKALKVLVIAAIFSMVAGSIILYTGEACARDSAIVDSEVVR